MRPLSGVQASAAAPLLYESALVRILFVILAVLLVVPQWADETRLPLLRPNAPLSATRVALDPRDHDRTRLGKLTFLGGIHLTSTDPAFGGFSSLTVSGDRFTMLSDGGNVLRFRMGSDWRPQTIWSGPLPDGPGVGWVKSDRDSESMTTDGRHVWLGFERANAIWRYTEDFHHADGQVKPKAMRKWPGNGGAEAMTELPDGRFAIISEQAHVPPRYWASSDKARLKTRIGLLFSGDPLRDPTPRRFAYIATGRYDVSDATALPDGDLVVLNRRFSLPFRFSTLIVRVKAADVVPGGIARPEPLATLDAPLVHDNFEGIAATRQGDATILWIVSDDNESLLQRTLLLKFRLDG